MLAAVRTEGEVRTMLSGSTGLLTCHQKKEQRREHRTIGCVPQLEQRISGAKTSHRLLATAICQICKELQVPGPSSTAG